MLYHKYNLNYRGLFVFQRSNYQLIIFKFSSSIICCLCDVSIGSIANFRRHFKSKHNKVKLVESVRCSLCNYLLKDGRGAGVHLKRFHDIGSKDDYPISPSPILSFIDKPTDSVQRSTNSSGISSLSMSPVSMSCPVSGLVNNYTIDEDSTPCDSSTSQPSSNIPRSLNPSANPFLPMTHSSGYVPQDHVQSSSPVHLQPSTPDQTSSQYKFQHLSSAHTQPLSADNSQPSFLDHLQRGSLCPASVHHSHSIHFQSLPQPQLIDLEEDDDFNTDSPPRILQDNNTIYTGTKDQAQQYFSRQKGETKRGKPPNYRNRISSSSRI